MRESPVQAAIRLGLGRLRHTRLWRNSRGKGWIGPVVGHQSDGSILILKPQRIEFGLVNGASDLIGLTQITITADMVGKTVAVFTAIEVKPPGEEAKTHQQHFIDFVNNFGGLAGVAHSPDEATRLVTRRG